MIVGIGYDIFDVSRMRKGLRGDKDYWHEEVFTPREIAYCEGMRYPARHFAARFAAKEALLKALAYDGQGGFVWRQIEIARNRDGQPRVILRGALKKRASNLSVNRIHVTLSHTAKLAAAQVVIES